MKRISKLFLIIIGVLFSHGIYAQREFVSAKSENSLFQNMLSDQSYQPKELHLKKSKNQKTTAWILLGGGTAMIIGGAIGFDDSWDKSSEYTKTDIFGFITLAGIISDLVSIPFFISSAKHREIAISRSFVIPNYPPRTSQILSKGIQPVVKIRF